MSENRFFPLKFNKVWARFKSIFLNSKKINIFLMQTGNLHRTKIVLDDIIKWLEM